MRKWGGKGWDGKDIQWRGTLVRAGKDGKITVGICARDKKAKSKQMESILSRFDPVKFELIYFGDQCILEQPVEDWPVCDCLIAFFSSGFPLEKAKAYVQLRKPYSLNDLSSQKKMQDRRQVYDTLKEAGIELPRHVYVNRDGYGGSTIEGQNIKEADDYIEVNGINIHKPFVEKPVDAEDHSVYIYYPMSAGGGSKRLFRKVGDRSSEFYETINEVRTEGSYIYEEFVETQGTDVKVYTVGPNYGHAEARKSPALDGKVNRDSEGKEIRYPVLLSAEEKDIASRVTLAFKQCVCGFDILRVQERSYVCDVNGWSFVKNSRKYHEDCAMLLAEFIEAAVKPTHRSQIFSTLAPLIQHKTSHHHHGPGRGAGASHSRYSYSGPSSPTSSVGSNTDLGHMPTTPPGRSPVDSPPFDSAHTTPSRRGSGGTDGGSSKHKHPEELRCVISITRHGDRTPKQKMKMKVSFQHYLDYYRRYSPESHKDLKVKGKNELKEFLKVTVDLIQSLGDDSGVDDSTRMKLYQIRHVLERWEISGINRKLQLKPCEWDGKPAESGRRSPVPAGPAPPMGSPGAGKAQGPPVPLEEVKESLLEALPMDKRPPEQATKLLLILKWGGELTKLGERQAIELGNNFRRTIYPDSTGGGLLRLHSTFRHDLKIRTSDEGRVMKTAAAFAKGFLELEGELTPLLVSLVHKEGAMLLDQSGNKDIKQDMARCKSYLHDLMSIDAPLTEEAIKSLVPARQDSVKGALRRLKNPYAKMHQMRDLIKGIVGQLESKVAENPLTIGEGRVSNRDRDRDRGQEEAKYSRSRVEKSDKEEEEEAHAKERKRREKMRRGMAAAADSPPHSPVPMKPPTNPSSPPPPHRGHGRPGGVLGEVVDVRALPGGQSCEVSTATMLSAAPPVALGSAEKPPPPRHDEGGGLGWASQASSPTGKDSNRPPARGETLLLMLDRWRKLHKELYAQGKGGGPAAFDISKIPDVHDCIRYDCLHNSHLRLTGMAELYDLAKCLADCAVPQEYGITVPDKLVIGSKMCSALLDKIKGDLVIARQNNEMDMRYHLDLSHAEDLPINSLGRKVRTRLYFTSESHLHTLLNVLRYPIEGHPSMVTEEARRMLSRTKELCYLTSFVIRLFEDLEKPLDDPAHFRVEILFTPGVVKHPLLPGDHLHTAPLVPLHKNLTCAQLESVLDAAIALSARPHPDNASMDHVVDTVKQQLAAGAHSPAGSRSPERRPSAKPPACSSGSPSENKPDHLDPVHLDLLDDPGNYDSEHSPTSSEKSLATSKVERQSRSETREPSMIKGVSQSMLVGVGLAAAAVGIGLMGAAKGGSLRN